MDSFSLAPMAFFISAVFRADQISKKAMVEIHSLFCFSSLLLDFGF